MSVSKTKNMPIYWAGTSWGNIRFSCCKPCFACYESPEKPFWKDGRVPIIQERRKWRYIGRIWLTKVSQKLGLDCKLRNWTQFRERPRLWYNDFKQLRRLSVFSIHSITPASSLKGTAPYGTATKFQEIIAVHYLYGSSCGLCLPKKLVPNIAYLFSDHLLACTKERFQYQNRI